jgi:hypothetical protein
MIWEVDENLDGCVDWDEFELLYERKLNDTTGLEPSSLFTIVQVTVACHLLSSSHILSRSSHMKVLVILKAALSSDHTVL